MAIPMSQEEKVQRGAEDAGRYFRYMMEFVGFTPEDAQAIRQSSLIIEKHLPSIVADFYSHLLRYPPTRKHFINKQGTIDQGYLQKRMHHLTNFWRRTASGVYDDDYARYVDYVGRAHTAHGADPGIYIAERYVIGQVGFMQHAISTAVMKELHGFDDDLEHRAVTAWNKLMMVILEMLSRVYGFEHEAEHEESRHAVDGAAIEQMAVNTYEAGLGLVRPSPQKEVFVGHIDEISDGERKIMQVDDFSIGVFHHKGSWYAVHNHCLHRGGPVATGCLEGDTIICPWHGYQYNLPSGELLVDRSVKLQMFPVTIRDGELYVQVPAQEETEDASASLPAESDPPADVAAPAASTAAMEKVEEETSNGSPADVVESSFIEVPALQENEFRVSEVGPGQTRQVHVQGQRVAVYNLNGAFYATQDACTHAGGPLSEGDMDGSSIICPWHGSCFDVTNGEVRCGPAKEPLKTYIIDIQDDVGRVS